MVAMQSWAGADMTNLRDIERLVNSADQWEPPTEEQLAEAPLLEAWSILRDDQDPDDLPVVTGIITGHPFVPDGSIHFGAECFAMDPAWEWIATMARIYRLGEPIWARPGEAYGNDD
jgi:hypothetical protein